MRKAIVGGLVLALLVIAAVPVFAAPWWASRPGPVAPRGPGIGPLAVGQTIPADVHAAIEAGVQAAAANALGMTPEALRQALATKPMVVVAAEKNVPIATVGAAMQQARTTAINDLVKAGKLTAQQATVLLQAGPGRGRGFGGGVGAQPGYGPGYGIGYAPGRGPGRPGVGRGPRW